MNRRRILIITGIVIAIVVVGTIFLSLRGPAMGNIFSNITANFAAAPAAMPQDGLVAFDEARMGQAAQEAGEGDIDQQQRVILKDATMGITVADVPAKISEIGAMAEEMGGWIVTSSTSQSTASKGERLTYGNITVRVPAERLDEAMERIRQGVESVNNENINGRDVTQQYVDLSSRLKNLEAAERQLQALMDDAANVTDVMTVFNQLVNTRGEIESIRGQLNYFDQASAFSSIQVTLSPPAPGAVLAQTTGWSPLKTAQSALGALIGLLQGIADLLIVVVIVILPPVLVIGLPIWLIYRRSQRRQAAVQKTR
jgi:hypothetical protein